MKELEIVPHLEICTKETKNIRKEIKYGNQFND